MEIMGSEWDTLQVFIFIIDNILPPRYHSEKLEGIQTELKVCFISNINFHNKQ